MKSKSTLSEEQIRPKNLIKRIKKSIINDQNFLLKRKKKFKKVNCPACNNRRNYFYLKKMVLIILFVDRVRLSLSLLGLHQKY